MVELKDVRDGAEALLEVRDLGVYSQSQLDRRFKLMTHLLEVVA